MNQLKIIIFNFMAIRKNSGLVPPTLYYCGHNAKKLDQKNLCWKFARSIPLSAPLKGLWNCSTCLKDSQPDTSRYNGGPIDGLTLLHPLLHLPSNWRPWYYIITLWCSKPLAISQTKIFSTYNNFMRCHNRKFLNLDRFFFHSVCFFLGICLHYALSRDRSP